MTEADYLSRSEQDTLSLGQTVANALLSGPGSGDLLLISGDLGAGKSAFVRAIIRHIADDPEYEVPSPTYTLCQHYDLSLSFHHFDLYRISGMDELDELGWEDSIGHGVAAMEWPENCFDEWPDGAVHVKIEADETGQRRFSFKGSGDLFDRINRGLERREFLNSAKLQNATCRLLAADASARSYEIVSSETRSFFLMDSPKMTDGPIIRDNKPYSQIAHLAESVHAFVGVGKLLLETGATAPEIPNYDLDRGLLLIEHLGDAGIIDDNRSPIRERYLAAAEMLAEFHQNEIRNTVHLDDTHTYKVPDYDEQAMLIEAELLVDWFIPEFSDNDLTADQRQAFVEIWRDLYATVDNFEKSLVLRDFHSPNILWLADKNGPDRIGVLDFQDALIGPSAYDVASLAQDARVSVEPELEQAVISNYIACRQRLAKPFSESDFLASYAIMSAQRATKILGIFVRLNLRDGKPGYLKHLPRMKDYLERSLGHPALSAYRNWLKSVIKL